MTVPQIEIVTSSVVKPDLDDRSYKIIRLPNQLEAILIHDPTTDKSAAALDVNVGSLADPKDLPGLAHFCEHLLFMGNEKYPSENDYAQYLSKHSGYSNAYTASEETNYFFEVGHEFLEGALDRFAQFFISPLFSPDCKDREINAVDSENKKNLQDDLWRSYQVEKTTSNVNHPYNGFSTGNFESLGSLPLSRGQDVREELLKFHKNHYSSNIMKLAVLGREPLDVLESWVLEKFSQIQNYDRPTPSYDTIPFSSNETAKIVKWAPVKEKRTFKFTFPLPDQTPHWRDQSSRYISSLLGHEAKGSILFYLKQKGWATDLSVGHSHITAGADCLTGNIDLTSNGLIHYKEVLIAVFQYIKILQNTPPQEWFYNEIKNILAMSFKFRQKSRAATTVSTLSSTLQKNHVDREYILDSTLVSKFNPEGIKEYLSYLTPSNLRLFLTSNVSEELNLREKWYGVEYSYKDIDPSFLNLLANASPNPDLHLPSPNEFIPTDFTVHRKTLLTPPAKQPTLIENTSDLKIWYKKDDTFWVPKAVVGIDLKSPISTSTPYFVAISELYSDIIDDAFNDVSYDAIMGGLTYSFGTTRDGFRFSVFGYNQKLNLLLIKFFKFIKNFEIDELKFKSLKEKLLKNYKNSSFKSPYLQITGLTLLSLNEKTVSYQEKIKQLELIDFDSFKRLIPVLLSQLQTQVLVHGNLEYDEAIEFGHLVDDILKPTPLPESNKILLRNVILPIGKTFRSEVILEDSKEINSAINYYLQVCDNTDIRLRSLLSLFAQIGSEPAFNQLRSKEQLGYVVFSGVMPTRTKKGYRIIIQSERETPYLEYRIDEFLILLEKIILEMNDEEFQKNIDSLIIEKLESLKNLNEEYYRFWDHISSGFYNFQKNEEDVKILKTLTKKDILEFYYKFIDPRSNERSKHVLHLKSQSPVKQSTTKLITSSLSNYFYSLKIDFSSNKLDSIINDHEDLLTISNLSKLIPKLKEIFNPDVTDVENILENAINVTIKSFNEEYPENYPTGYLITNNADFKSSLPLAPTPAPIYPWSFYEQYQGEIDGNLKSQL